MIAIDTNILARYVRNDDPVQSAAARRLTDEDTGADDPLFVSNEVLVELYWLLSKRQGLSRASITDLYWALLDNAHLTFADRVTLSSAIDAYGQGPAGFVDYLIAAVAASQGAAFTYTFDRDAARHPTFKPLPSRKPLPSGD